MILLMFASKCYSFVLNDNNDINDKNSFAISQMAY